MIILISVLLVIGGIAFITNRSKLYSPVNWLNITPGISTEEEVINILGIPDKKEERKGFQIYTYEGRLDLGWKWVEIWLEPKRSSVIGVFLSIPHTSVAPDDFRLANLVKYNKKPNFISWSPLRYERFFAWTNRGIAIDAVVSSLPHSNPLDLSQIKTTQAYLFEPQSVVNFTYFDWPWPAGAGWSSENMYKSGETDAPDLQSIDPFDWEKFIQ